MPANTPATPAASTTRRDFLKTTAAASAWALTASSYGRVLGSNAQLRVAYIGVDGIAGGQHIAPLAALGAGCLCYCDVDRTHWGNCADRWPEATGYTDYRRMFDTQHKDIDAVMIGTPDHHHYPASMIAMMLGKHVYTQKPLTHTVWESRQLALAQKRYKVATQMGNQLHGSEDLRKTIDYLRGGAIGDLTEAHIWTNRPGWLQGAARPAGEQPVPDHLNWDAWIGPAPKRPYLGGVYHPFKWRGWCDFGCGALGDMACHDVDPLYWAMLPGIPTAVELIDSEPYGDAEMFEKRGTVRYEFPARGDRPGFAMYWYEGGRKPPRPAELEPETQLTSQGAIYIGTKGTMIALPRGAAPPRLLPQERHEEYGVPAQAIARSEGHHREWYDACVGDRPYNHPKSNFAYAAPFTEALLLGLVVQRVGGRLEYDPATMHFTNNSAATPYITKPYRDGWEFKLD